MASAPKLLGQVAPAVTTITTVYTVPGATATHVTLISVANRSNTSSRFRLSARPGASGLATNHYLYYDIEVPGNDTFIGNIALMLPAAAVVEVYADSANLTVILSGVEIT